MPKPKAREVELSCQACGVKFLVPHWRKVAKFCSAGCAGRHRNDHLKKPKVEFICPECGTYFWEHKSRAGWRRFCSNECRNKNEEYRKESCARHKGDLCYNWKGGISRQSDGYLYEKSYKHPFSNRDYVLQHRLVMEKWLREFQPESSALVEIEGEKYLRPELVVHHKNHIRDDNRIENLQLMTNGDHQRLHNKIRRESK